jgi:glycosyltransferase involved in cell wall biosynthesis
MDMTPLVTVAINNYNYGRFLPHAIESALAQRHPRMQVVVVDDGSTDDSVEVMGRYAERIEIIRQANQGQAAALNTGFAHSRGDVVIFLDADDTLLPETASQIAAVFQAAPDLARVQYRLAIVDAEGKPTGELIPAAYAVMPNGDRRRELARFNNYGWWPPTSGNAFSASALRRFMPMPDAHHCGAADYYMVRAATLCGPIRSLDLVGGHYRTHDANKFLRHSVDLEQTRFQIQLIEDTHRYLKAFAASIAFNPFPATASDAWDLPFYALRMTSLRLDPAAHPIPADRLLSLGWRGTAVALRQTQRSAAYRLAAAAWFTAMIVLPRSAARLLAEWFFYPARRPALVRPHPFHERTGQ